MSNDTQVDAPVERSTARPAPPLESEQDAARSAALLALAHRLATAELPRARKPWTRHWPILAALAAALALLIAAAAVLLTAGGSGGREPASASATSQPATTASGGDGQALATERSASETSAAPPTTIGRRSPDTTAAPTTVATSPSAPTAATGALPDSYMRYAGGVLTLVGAVPTRELADAERSWALSILPADRVAGRLAVDPDAEPPSGLIVIDAGVVFAKEGSTIRSQFHDELDLLVSIMRRHPAVAMVATGHTDAEGSEDYNMRLSLARAQAVLGYLEDQGIDPARLSAVGQGETQPIASNDTSEGRAQNRRIDIRLLNLDFQP